MGSLPRTVDEHLALIEGILQAISDGSMSATEGEKTYLIGYASGLQTAVKLYREARRRV